MPNTYTQLHIQVVFAVKKRAAVIHPDWKQELYRYMAGIIQHQNHKVLIINGMPDHVHILLGLNPVQSLSALMQDIKGSSSKWINDSGFINNRFLWQEGYGAFSYSKSQIDRVYNYIKNQEQHHSKKNFIEEYKSLLEEHRIKYHPKYIFSDLV